MLMLLILLCPSVFSQTVIFTNLPVATSANSNDMTLLIDYHTSVNPSSKRIAMKNLWGNIPPGALNSTNLGSAGKVWTWLTSVSGYWSTSTDALGYVPLGVTSNAVSATTASYVSGTLTNNSSGTAANISTFTAATNGGPITLGQITDMSAYSRGLNTNANKSAWQVALDIGQTNATQASVQIWINSATGDDAQAARNGVPWKTIDAAWPSIQSGDTVLLTGNFTPPVTTNITTQLRLMANKNNVRITGNGSAILTFTNWGYGFIFTNCNDLSIDGLTMNSFRDLTLDEPILYGALGFDGVTTAGLSVRYCTFSNWNDQVLTVGPYTIGCAKDVDVSFNRFFNCGTTNSYTLNDVDGSLMSSFFYENAHFENNYMSNVFTVIEIEPAGRTPGHSLKNNGLYVRNNVGKEIGGQAAAILIDSVTASRRYDNIVYSGNEFTFSTNSALTARINALATYWDMEFQGGDNLRVTDNVLINAGRGNGSIRVSSNPYIVPDVGIVNALVARNTILMTTSVGHGIYSDIGHLTNVLDNLIINDNVIDGAFIPVVFAARHGEVSGNTFLRANYHANKAAVCLLSGLSPALSGAPIRGSAITNVTIRNNTLLSLTGSGDATNNSYFVQVWGSNVVQRLNFLDNDDMVHLYPGRLIEDGLESGATITALNLRHTDRYGVGVLPEGLVKGLPGSTWTLPLGGVGSSLLVKQSASSATTGWTAFNADAVADSRLSANVALLNRSVQNFTGGTNSFAGNVGIATTGPTAKLDVAGDIRLSGPLIGTLVLNQKSIDWSAFGESISTNASFTGVPLGTLKANLHNVQEITNTSASAITYTPGFTFNDRSSSNASATAISIPGNTWMEIIWSTDSATNYFAKRYGADNPVLVSMAAAGASATAGQIQISTGAGGYTNGTVSGSGTVTSVSTDTNMSVATATSTPAITFTNYNGTGPFTRSNAPTINAPTLIAPALGTIASGNGAALTALAAANITADGTLPRLVATGFDSPTNLWVADSAFGLGTNYFISQAAATVGITGIANGPTTTERYGQLIVLATGTVVFTNVAGIKCNDGLTTRTITNGNSATIAVDVMPGRVTNLFIVQTW